ncbi:MAG: hypothetical protein LBG80_08675 [Bacteroidales bacterium]|jgi:hypothetical protein|nr:hypothetical protein [Bacteroidales bacterium]
MKGDIMQKINTTKFCLTLLLTILFSIFISTFLLVIGESYVADSEDEPKCGKSGCKEGGPSGNIKVDETNWLGQPTGKKIPAPSETYTICGKCQNLQYVCTEFLCRNESGNGFFDDDGNRTARRFVTYKPIKLGTCVETSSKKDKCKKCRLKNNKGVTLPACHTEYIYQVDLDVNCSGNGCCNRLTLGIRRVAVCYNYNMSSVSNCLEN